MNESKFLFACCQTGAERALKEELAVTHPEFRFAYSRPGFVTFKLPDAHGLAGDFDLASVFARAFGFSLGKVRGEDAAALAKEVAELVGNEHFRHVHVWQRDEKLPGEDGFEPGPTELAEEVGRLIAAVLPRQEATDPPAVNAVPRSGTRVLDCVLVEPTEWWIGWHAASAPASRWPGGVCPLDDFEPAVSRAYLKMCEALAWSRLPIQMDDRCVEIGSAPGGACLALLDRGLKVTGVDPAEMDEAVLAHPNFTHLRKRGREVPRRDFRGVRWLVTDLNVAPKYSLDTVEEIVTHESVQIRGLLLTLKLADWKLAAQIPEFLDRIRSWGYGYVRARQLAFNRREICVAALTSRAARRVGAGQQRGRAGESRAGSRRRRGD